MPSITRRRLVASGAAVAACGYGGYRLVRGAPDAAFATWTPEPGTWPLHRYDPANTAHNPHASPPREQPETREFASLADIDGDSSTPRFGVDEPYFRPLVGADRLAVSGTWLATYAGGETTPLGESGAHLAGFGPDGRLHAVRRPEMDTEIVGFDGNERAYRATVPGHAEGLTVGRDEVYVGTVEDDVVAFDGGSRNWTADGETTALSDGRLYTAGGRDGTLAYRERDRPARLVSPGPERVWSAPSVRGSPDPPAVADGRLVVGTRGMFGGALAAVDAATGDRLWEPKTFDDDGVAGVSTPAVAGRDGYVAAGVDGFEAGFVARYDLETGDRLWRADTDWYAYDPALAGDTLVVAGDVRAGPGAPASVVRAYDAASGDELWTAEFPGDGATYVALVGQRVIATVGRSLYELT